jgi:hypothetical protein
MISLTKFILGLISTTFIAPLCFLLLFFCIGSVVGLYKWHLNSWEQGTEIMVAIFEISFSWAAIKFYLLAWGVGILMVCYMTYGQFKLSIHEWFRKFM